MVRGQAPRWNGRCTSILTGDGPGTSADKRGSLEGKAAVCKSTIPRSGTIPTNGIIQRGGVVANLWGDVEINSLLAEHQYNWLLKEVGEEKIRKALLAMPQSRKGYPLNIAIFLRIRLPKKEDLLPDCVEDPSVLPPRQIYPVRVSRHALMRRFRERFSTNGRMAELRKYRDQEKGGRFYVADRQTGKPIGALYTKEGLEAFAKQLGLMKPYEVFDDTDPRENSPKVAVE